MDFFGKHGFAAFQPPSDMSTSPGGGGGRSKLWVGLGIGCGLVLLVIGILFAAGAFQAVSCCSEVKNLAESSVAVRDAGQAFANEVQSGNVDAAYARTSPDYKGRVSKEQFAQGIAANKDAMQVNTPRLFDMQLQNQNAESIKGLSKGKWRLSYQFAGPRDEKMLLLSFTVQPVGEGSEQKFVVDDVHFDERLRDLASEPPADEVLRVHQMIQDGNTSMAYTRFAPGFQQETDLEAFKAFLRDAGEVMTSSSLEIREVAYNESSTQATVIAHAKTFSGQNAIVQYELVPLEPEMPGFGWRIVSIAPLIGQVAEPPAEPSPSPADEVPTANPADAGGEVGASVD